jgi:hypothetical protein
VGARDTENKRDTLNKKDTREEEKDNTETRENDTEEETAEKETKGKEGEWAQQKDRQGGRSSTGNVTTVDWWDTHRERAQKRERGLKEIATPADSRDTREYNVPNSNMGKGKQKEE